MSPSDRRPSNAHRMANVVLGVVRDHPRATTAEVVALTNERLARWAETHTVYPAPTCAPTAGLRKLERTGRVERLRGDEPRWILREVAPTRQLGRYGRLEVGAR